MDILAARKKAAERARAGKHDPAPQPLPARDEEPLEEEAPAFPPLPETGSALDEAALDEERVPLFPPIPETAFVPDEEAVPGKGTQTAPVDAVKVAAPSVLPADAPEALEGPAAEGDDEQDAVEREQEQEREMLAFLLGTEEYVVPVERVQEVLTPREITPIPHSKKFVLGVCSLRGIVLPIIDLHRRLGLAEAAWGERSRIVVLNLGPDDRIGLFVDRVRGVVRFLPSVVRPVPETVEQGAEFLQGIVRKDDRLLILLDVQKTTEI